jgi:hypothetical protein
VPALLCAVLVPALVPAPGDAARNGHGTAQDRASTRALLHAELAYRQALLADAAASTAAVRTYAHTLEQECPGVLTGAPHPSASFFEGPPPEQRLTPRQRGEQRRQERQLSAFDAELFDGFAVAIDRPARQATAAFLGAIRPLRWSNPGPAGLIKALVQGLERLIAAPPAVCSDMRAWAASGYTTLAPTTKMLDQELGSGLGLVIALAAGGGDVALTRLGPFSKYEGPSERKLARQIEVLAGATFEAETALSAVARKLTLTLGIETQTERENFESFTRPRKGSVEIGHGRTLAGTNYTIVVEPPGPPSPPTPLGPSGCKTQITITEQKSRGSSSSSGICLSRAHPAPPLALCNPFEGRISVDVQTRTRTRRVRLRLSDGRQVTSRVALVPPRLGGPVGFYYQVLRGPSPVPVSLTELGAGGKVLRVVRLPHIHPCVKKRFRFPKTTTRTIVRGRLAGGPSFAIVGERTKFMGHVSTDVNAQTNEQVTGGFSIGENYGAAGRHRRPPPFTLKRKTGCQPHEYAILYGVLKAPKDTVLVRLGGSGTLQPLRRARIPASLHIHGVLAYIALPAVPEELLVRDSSGKTVVATKLAAAGREARETCEGEAEG